MDLSSPGFQHDQIHEESNGNRLVTEQNVSSASSSSQSRSNSSSPLSTSSSSGSTWYKLQLGAKPVKISRTEWMCSQGCKKKKEIALFKDCQAVEKHILRKHPDPTYNEFVCLFAWCKMARTSPQQILDHLGQAEKNDGHELKDQYVKYESTRAVHTETKEKFRVLRDRKEFAWYICISHQQPVEEARPSSFLVKESNKDNKPNNQFSYSQVDSPTGAYSQNDNSGRRDGRSEFRGNSNQIRPPLPGLPHGGPPGVPPSQYDISGRHFDPDIMLTNGFSALPG